MKNFYLLMILPAIFLISLYVPGNVMADDTGISDCKDSTSCPSGYQCESFSGYSTGAPAMKCANYSEYSCNDYTHPKGCKSGETCVYERDFLTKKPYGEGKCVVPAKDADTSQEENSCGKAFLTNNKKEGTPACQPLYAYNTSSKACVFAGTRNVTLDSDTADNFEKVTDEMQANQSNIFEGKFKNGTPFKMGIMKKPDGTFEFTKDGVHYTGNLKDVLQPGFFTRVGNGWQSIKEILGGLWGSGKYTGPDTAGENGKANQLDGQNRLDAATAALKDLAVPKTADQQTNLGKEIVGRWVGDTTKLLQGKNVDVLLNELKAVTGCDLPLLKKILNGDIVAETINKDAILQQLYTFPAQSVTILAKEMKATSFAGSAYVYIKERAGQPPEKILELMQSGQLPELDLVSNIKGTNQQFAAPALFSAYEEAYQRYLLAKGLRTSL